MCSYFEFIINVETCFLSGYIDTYLLSLTLPLGSPNLTNLLSGSYKKYLQTPAVEVASGPPTCDCHRWGWLLTCCGPSQIHEILVLEFSRLQPEKNGPRFPTGTLEKCFCTLTLHGQCQHEVFKFLLRGHCPVGSIKVVSILVSAYFSLLPTFPNTSMGLLSRLAPSFPASWVTLSLNS